MPYCTFAASVAILYFTNAPGWLILGLLATSALIAVYRDEKRAQRETW